jgi:hypothetical protein
MLKWWEQHNRVDNAATECAQPGIGAACTVICGVCVGRACGTSDERRLPAGQVAAHRGGNRKAAGFDVPVDVEWDQPTISGDASHYPDDEYYAKTIFQPLVGALNSITADQMGRDSLEAKLQRIRVRFDEKTAPASNYPNGLSFANGVLEINWRPYSNTPDVDDRTKALTQIMEKSL